MLMMLPTRSADADDAGSVGLKKPLLLMMFPTRAADADDAGRVGLKKH